MHLPFTKDGIINYPAASQRGINVLNIVAWMECNGIRGICSTSHPTLRYAASQQQALRGIKPKTIKITNKTSSN